MAGETNLEIEALIEKAPHEAQHYLVYADWLQERGDPRGKLIVLQHQLASAKKLDDVAKLTELERVEEALLKEHEVTLLGPLAPHTTVLRNEVWHRGIAWRFGFVRALVVWAPEMQLRPDSLVASIMREALDHPSLRFLERLIIPASGRENPPAELFDVFKQKAPKTLEALVLDTRHFPGLRLTEVFWNALPQLRELILGDHTYDLGVIHADALERLEAVNASSKSLLATACFPSLKRLRLGISAHRDLPAILSSDRMPKLEHFSFSQWETRKRDGEPLPKDAFGLAVLKGVAARSSGLARLDLAVPFSPGGSTKFLAMSKSLGSIQRLRLPKQAVLAADRRAELTAAIPGIEWSDEILEREDHEDVMPFHHEPPRV